MVGHVLVLAAALTCLRLGWWQWTVFEAARGTGQNLGYSLLWPVFAGSFIYMWLRFLHLEGVHDEGARSALREREALPDAAADPDSEPSAEPRPDPSAEGSGPGRRHNRAAGHEVYTVGIGYIGDDDDDPELAAYNRALARLAEQDDHGAP